MIKNLETQSRLFKNIYVYIFLILTFNICHADYDVFMIEDSEYQTVGLEINNLGEVVGAFLNDNNKIQGGFLWSLSEKKATSLIRNKNDSYPVSINNQGVIIGYGHPDTDLWKLSSKDIEGLSTYNSKKIYCPRDIIKINDNEDLLCRRVSYASQNGRPNSDISNDFNNNGIKAGSCYTPQKISFDGKALDAKGIATAINDYNTYVGITFCGQNNFDKTISLPSITPLHHRMHQHNASGNHAFISNSIHSITLIETEMIASYATDINNLDVVVGYFYVKNDDCIFDNYSTRAFIFQNGKFEDLNKKICNSSKITLSAAISINDSGMILCIGKIGDKYKSFVLAPK